MSSSPDPNYKSLFYYKPLPNEIERKQLITEQDVKTTLNLFSDFHVPIPDNFTKTVLSMTYYSELENWRRYYILNNLPMEEELNEQQ